jgi:hypothetical protein
MGAHVAQERGAPKARYQVSLLTLTQKALAAHGIDQRQADSYLPFLWRAVLRETHKHSRVAQQPASRT